MHRSFMQAEHLTHAIIPYPSASGNRTHGRWTHARPAFCPASGVSSKTWASSLPCPIRSPSKQHRRIARLFQRIRSPINQPSRQTAGHLVRFHRCMAAQARKAACSPSWPATCCPPAAPWPSRPRHLAWRRPHLHPIVSPCCPPPSAQAPLSPDLRAMLLSSGLVILLPVPPAK